MATYKVLQDVEAEDKILGPLTLRQFVYAGITVILLYLSYFVFTKGAGFLVIIFLPLAGAFGFFAFPWGRDQPTEVWALAKIRFLFKPRRRIWDQSGVKELVTITAPKVIQEIVASQLSQNEVKSRLRALADTIDTRGWAIKNIGSPAFSTQIAGPQPAATDRLLDVSNAPAQQLVATDVTASDDIMDERANAQAQRVDSMISAAATAHRQKLMDELQSSATPAQPPKPPADYWFLNQPAQPTPSTAMPGSDVTFAAPQVVVPGATINEDSQATPTATDKAIINELEEHKEQGPTSSYYGHMRTIQPMSAQKEEASKHPPEIPATQTTQPPPAPPPPVTPTQQAAILQLASNKDLNVATIAREANRIGPDDEVVVKLH